MYTVGHQVLCVLPGMFCIVSMYVGFTASIRMSFRVIIILLRYETEYIFFIILSFKTSDTNQKAEGTIGDH
jgi:hypothetical protein